MPEMVMDGGPDSLLTFLLLTFSLKGSHTVAPLRQLFCWSCGFILLWGCRGGQNGVLSLSRLARKHICCSVCFLFPPSETMVYLIRGLSVCLSDCLLVCLSERGFVQACSIRTVPRRILPPSRESRKPSRGLRWRRQQQR